jgi:hypothetical protein
MALSGDEGRSCVSVCPGPEQARTIAFAMPILKRAAHVVVLTVEGGAAVPAPTGQQLCHYLQLSGVPAKPLTVGLNGRLTGEGNRCDQHLLMPVVKTAQQLAHLRFQTARVRREERIAAFVLGIPRQDADLAHVCRTGKSILSPREELRGAVDLLQADLANDLATQRIGAGVRLIDDLVDDRQVGAAGRAFRRVFIPSAAQIGGFTDQLMHPARQSVAGQIANRDNARTDLDQIIVGSIRVSHGHHRTTLNVAFSPVATRRGSLPDSGLRSQTWMCGKANALRPEMFGLSADLSQ